MKNNNIKPVGIPIELKFDKKPETSYKNNLLSIQVELIDAPLQSQLEKYLVKFVNATWSEEYDSYDEVSQEERKKTCINVFSGKSLPTALETIGLTFRISGISLQEVTHILRYRNASFSAECSDKWWTDKDALVPNAVENSEELYQRYKDVVRQCKELYCDMINTKKISLMDARYILPRCLETFYYMRMNLSDVIHFIKQRIDKQIQPETDNILAYLMYIELLKHFDYTNCLKIDIHSPSRHFINISRSGKSTNLYFPDEDSDKFEYNENDFIYHCRRDEMNGTNEGAKNLFNEYAGLLEEKMKKLEEINKNNLKDEGESVYNYFEETMKKGV